MDAIASRLQGFVLPFAPYYDRDGVTIYNADCRKVLPFLDRFDLLLTDPPYGIGAAKMNLGFSRTSRMTKGDWDDSTVPVWLVEAMIEAAEKHIIWGGNYYPLPPSRQYAIWDKGGRFKDRSFAECEQAWCSWDGVARLFRYDALGGEDCKKIHPTQKPLALMRWCLSLVPDAETVLDPFMGSGTTLVAAKLEGRRAVGIEISEKYCEAAASRLSQGTLF
jgi:DNA modification methylase